MKNRLPVIEHADLNPCPRCGGQAIIQQRWVHGRANKKHYKPVCGKCKFSFHDEYSSIAKAVSLWNSSGVNCLDMDMYRHMSKEELIDLIINNELVPIHMISAANKAVMEHLKSNGYSIVSLAFYEQAHKESLELARYKYNESKNMNEVGMALWEEEV